MDRAQADSRLARAWAIPPGRAGVLAGSPDSRRARAWAIPAALGLAWFLGGWLRFAALDAVPPGLWFDEALNARDARDVVRGGGLKLVYPDEFPREPMFVTLLAGAMRIFGNDVATLRAVSAAIGWATVFALFFGVRALTDARTAAIASASLAFMRWHLIFSRLLFRTILMPLWIVLIVWAAASLRRAPSVGRAVALGALIGGGFYTYLSWYFMLPGAALLAIWAFSPEWKSRAGRSRALAFLVAALIVAAPIGFHYARFPGHLASRPGAVSPFAEGPAAAAREIGKNFIHALGMFHVAGDRVSKQNIPRAPALDRLAGAGFALGLIVCVARARRRDPLSTIALGWLALGVAPTIFTKTDSPNFLRTLVATPAVAIAIAVGVGALWDFIARRGGRPIHARLGAALVILLVSASALISVRDVFGPSGWGNSRETWEGFNGPESQLARAALRHSPDRAVWIPGLMGATRTYQYLTDGAPGAILYEDFDFFRPREADDRPRAVITTAHNRLLPVLQMLAPGGMVIEELRDPGGRAWAVVFAFEALPPAEAVDRSEAAHPVRDRDGRLAIGW